MVRITKPTPGAKTVEQSISSLESTANTEATRLKEPSVGSAQVPQEYADGFEGRTDPSFKKSEVQSDALVPGTGRVPTLSAEVHRRLVELTKPDTLKDMYDLRSRISELDKIFVEHKDPRGLFTSLYRVITNGAVDSVEKGLYEDNEWGAKLTHHFGRRYLENLHGELTGGPTTRAWRVYYDQARDASVSPERVAAMGAIVHLVADLPQALVETGAPIERREDFMLFGDNLLGCYEEMIESARKGHGVHMDPVFSLLFVGDAIDAVAGDGTATRIGYQTIRNKTWYAARGLTDSRRRLSQMEIDVSWRGFERILAGLDATNMI